MFIIRSVKGIACSLPGHRPTFQTVSLEFAGTQPPCPRPAAVTGKAKHNHRSILTQIQRLHRARHLRQWSVLGLSDGALIKL